MGNKLFQGMLVDKVEDADIVFFGIPYDLGLSVQFRGASKAPSVFREVTSIMPPTTINGYKIDKLKIYDFGDSTGHTLEEIYSQSRELFETGKVKLIVGGDHSISIPMEQKFIERCEQNNQIPVVIHLDAEPNLADVFEGSFTHAKCVLRRLKGRGVKPENICVVGTRVYTTEELDFLQKYPAINVYKITDLRGEKLIEVAEEICAEYSGTKYAVYLSCSANVLDLAYAPGVSVPSPFGLKAKGAISFLEVLTANLNIRVIDIVDICPPRDLNNMTTWMIAKSLYEVLYQVQKRIHGDNK